MTKITIYFDRKHPVVEWKLLGRVKVLQEARPKNVDQITAEVPSGTYVKYFTYWTKFTKWKTEWIQRIVTTDLQYGAKPPKPCELPLTAELRKTLEAEAPETLKEPIRTQFATVSQYNDAVGKFERCGHWATPAPEPAPPTPPPVFPEETTAFWEAKGYSPAEALLIALWSKKNAATPGFAKIQEIIRLGGMPVPKAPPAETVLQKEWSEFFEHPDVITAIGLTPSSVQESFSLVFSNYSVINAREQSPETGDYASVFLILAGLTTLAATAIYAVLAAMPHVGVGGMMKGSAGISSKLSAAALKKAGAQLIKAAGVGKLAAIASKVTTSPWFALITVFGIYWINIWNLTDPMWWWGVEVKMTGDVKKRFESLRIDVNKKLQQAYALVYIDTDATKLASARTLLRATKPLITEMFNLLTGREIDKEIKEIYPEFVTSVEASVSQYNDLVVAAGGIADDYLIIEGLMAPPPELPVTFPKEFDLEDVQVVDGDSLAFPGHPEAKNEIRMLGVFAHEGETAAGKVETAYLKSLIENRTVTIKTHQHHAADMVFGQFGRLLGGVFLGDQDIALAMLEHFGMSLYPPSKYRKTYRWIDWDEYKRVAEAAVGPDVKEFKIYIDSTPSNAKLYIDGVYTHHLTPSDEKELKDVMDMLEPGKHVIMAQKAGLEGSVEVNITEGSNPDVKLTLQVVGLAPVEPEPAEPPAEPPVEPPVEAFRISILSTPSRAKVFIDGIYTHHLTPSNEVELRDVMHLLTPGSHIISVTKEGKAAEKVVDIKPGVNEPIYLTLQVVGIPVTIEELEKMISSHEAAIAALRSQLEKL